MRMPISPYADWHHADPAVIMTLLLGIVVGTLLATAF
jgi:hypothetical protein